MKELNFAIDYDGTYSHDPEIFTQIVGLLKERGHEVYIVTNRQPRQRKQVEEDVLQAPIDASNVLFCGQIPKKNFVRDHKIHIDVWIDNEPESIFGVQSL